MARLIDADKLKKHYAWWNNEEKKVFDDIVDLQPTVDAESLIIRHEDIGYERGYRDGYAEALDVTDDAEHVRHGHWYDVSNYLGTGKAMYVCSECGAGSSREDPYCWQCGSKMDVSDTDVGKMEEEEE